MTGNRGVLEKDFGVFVVDARGRKPQLTEFPHERGFLALGLDRRGGSEDGLKYRCSEWTSDDYNL